ncbi:hypothetical protein PLESTB_000389300 [Pleodorina starrii]|uniref:Indoleamine 2,3-dioxygenase n=1 Tax=Pleodorina starrii TaxID=330485 RepID=A0A9W6BEC1_9CHLO|nr:hypothetical protein PLESTB_000389300 [Pleodorina starrii]
MLSFLAHAYMWCEPGPPPAVLPAVLAVPWVRVAAALDMPPVLTYASYNLYNWRRLDPTGPVRLGNIVCLQNFLGGPDEEWFRLVHVEIEARAGSAVAAGEGGLEAMQRAAEAGDSDAVLAGLIRIAEALRDMQATLSRMGEKCDPYIYYQRVRTPMSGWRNNPNLPQGLIYEGVSPEPVQLYGETGAQSSILHAFDAALGVQHEQVRTAPCTVLSYNVQRGAATIQPTAQLTNQPTTDQPIFKYKYKPLQGWLRDYLDTMQLHMPPHHRAFLRRLTAANTGPANVRAFVQQHTGAASASIASSTTSGAAGGGGGGGAYLAGNRGSGGGGELLDAYNTAIQEMERFRSQHRAFAASYIAKWARRETTGTGGSDFMPALSGYRDTTGRHVLGGSVPPPAAAAVQ